MARAPMPAPQMIETPAMRRSALLAKMLEQQRQPTDIKGGYGELGARLLAQGITQWSANKAERKVKEEGAERLAGQTEAANLALARLLGGGGEGPAPMAEAPAPMPMAPPVAPPVTNTQEPVQAQIAPAANVAGSPLPPTGQPIPMADVPPVPQATPAPAPAAPAPQMAPQAPPQAAPNPLGVTPGEAALIQRALSSGDPGQIAWAQGVISEIETRMSAPPALRREYQAQNGVGGSYDPVTNEWTPLEGGVPEIARNETFVVGPNNEYGAPAGTLMTRSPQGVVSVVNRQEGGYELVGGQLRPIAGGPQDPRSGGNQITNERDLRREFDNVTSEYRNVRQAFQKVEASLAQGTGIGDVGGIFGVMKVFDPGSTVREGEAATVQNSGGVPEQIRGLYNRVANGERLTPQQRAEIIAVANAQFQTYEQGYNGRVREFIGMAEEYGLNPRNVVGGESPAPRPRPRPAPSRPRSTAPRPANVPPPPPGFEID